MPKKSKKPEASGIIYDDEVVPIKFTKSRSKSSSGDRKMSKIQNNYPFRIGTLAVVFFFTKKSL